MKTETEFEFGGEAYRIGVINAEEQFHIFRRLAPMVATMGVEMLRLLSRQQDTAEMSKTDWMVTVAPVIGEMARMPQEDVDYVIKHSLKVVRRRDGDMWAPLLNASGSLMYQNLSMPAMLRLIFEVLRHNLDDFFPEPQDGPAS